MKTTMFSVRDMIETPGFSGPRLYNVEGIHLGATSQEDVIELSTLDRTDPDSHGEKQTMLVPFEMLCAGIDSSVFLHTPVSELG